jgi:ppGpp synthetase/RelA/SpoT-type nucleotidyltranferase
MASGIVQVMAMLAIGDKRESCQKLNKIIGNAKLIADRVKTNASLIAKNSGKKKNILVKNF